MPSLSPEGGFPLALARGFAVAAMLSAFGSLVFRAVVLPKVVARVPAAARADGAIRRLARGSLGVAAFLLLVWALLQTADLVRPGLDFDRFITAWPVVLFGTLFGNVWLVQIGAVLAAAWLVGRRPGYALAACTLAVVLQAGHSHALSMYGGLSLLLGSDVVHLIAAGAWLGGLWPLMLVVRDTPPHAGALAARWFSPLGKWCVAGIVLSAGCQFWVLIGGLPGLLGTAYGWVAMAKLGLLGVLLGFAAVNRYRLAPALMRTTPDAAKWRLSRSVAVQTGFGLAVVLAAGVLGSLPPSLHEQPLWPFRLRPSLVAFDDPDLAQEVWTGLGLLSAAACLLAALAAGRLRRAIPLAVIVASASLLVWFAAPHLSVLLVEAYPTSYYSSPTEFAATGIVQGAGLFQSNCANCHGTTGMGDGPMAAGLPIPPADLTAAHLWEHSDGEMFWWLTHGMAAPDDTLAMPGFQGVLSASQRWAVIDAVRAQNAGTGLHSTGSWPHAVGVPEFDVQCSGEVHVTPQALRGQVLYLITDPGVAAPPSSEVTTVLLSRGKPDPGWNGCAATDPAAWTALGILVGQPAAALAGTRVLVDANGWLRTVKPAALAAVWNDQAVLAEEIRSIQAQPLVAAGGGHHHH